MVCMAMMAGPAKRGVYKTLNLGNDRQVRAMLVGDEHGRFWRGDDGKAYQLAGNCYMPVDEKALAEKANTRRATINARIAKRQSRTRGESDNRGSSDKHKGIVILVNFADDAFQEGHDNAIYQKIFNGENFHEPPFVGSVADYFRDQSRGQFLIDFDVFGPVTVSKEKAYYGANENGRDAHVCEMVIEAVNQVKDMPTDWHEYDWDGNGEVDHVYVIFAGNTEANTGNEDEIWAHMNYLTNSINSGDGTRPVQVTEDLVVDKYACSSELNRKYNICGIGDVCHEYSHCLGLFDTYDVDYEGGQGMGYWDLMDSGLELDDSYCPSGYTSFERMILGWMEPIELKDGDTTVTNMKSLQEGGESYIILNKSNDYELYLLENRQNDKWDASLPGRGLLITHVDFDPYAWYDNTMNTDYRHQRITRVPASGVFQIGYTGKGSALYSLKGYAQETFPQEGVSAFNRSFKTLDIQAKRAARLFTPNIDGTDMIDSSVENITQNDDGTISFNFVAAYSGEAYDDSPKTVNLEDVSGYYVLQDGTTLTGTLNQRAKIMIDRDATVTLSGVRIHITEDGKDYAAGLNCISDATIILDSGTENFVWGLEDNYPGIMIPAGKTLTIKGDGQLTAGSNANGAGIGGGCRLGCGNILIEGGTIYAEGGVGAAGIGVGYGGQCGDITITTGVTSVTAKSAGNVYSIGAGYGDEALSSSCGTVTIGGVETGSISENPYTYIPGASHITSIANSTHSNGKWYSLDGRQLKGKPTAKGVYIHSRRKVVVK